MKERKCKVYRLFDLRYFFMITFTLLMIGSLDVYANDNGLGVEDRKLSNNPIDKSETSDKDMDIVSIMLGGIEDENYESENAEDVIILEQESPNTSPNKTRIIPEILMALGFSTLVGIVIIFSYLVKVKGKT